MRRLNIMLPGRRKAVYGTASFIAICGGAVVMTDASYDNFTNSILLWLAAMLTGHVAQQASAPKTSAAVEPGGAS